MALPLREEDFAMFTSQKSAAAPQREPQRPHPKTKPRRERAPAPQRRERPVRQVPAMPEETMQAKNQKAKAVWKRTLVSYAVVTGVAFSLFAIVQSETAHYRAVRENHQLQAELSVVQQRNISYRTQVDRMFSLEVVQDLALNQYRMVPVEAGRVTYLNIPRGDQLLDES